MRGYLPPQNAQEQMVVKRVTEAARAAEWTSRFLGFYDEREQLLARTAVDRMPDVTGVFWGGFPSAQRCFLGLSGAAEIAKEDFPIVTLCISCYKPDGLTHRDYLGSLMALGLKREAIGDILPNESGAVCFLTQAAARVAEETLTSVGRFSASARPAPTDLCFLQEEHTEELSVNVPSLRADAVLSQMLHVARSEAAGLIGEGRVSVNHVEISSPHYQIEQGDLFSVRGCGRYSIEEIGGLSRKGRLWLKVKQFK